jgi:hypothetical protein
MNRRENPKKLVCANLTSLKALYIRLQWKPLNVITDNLIIL